MGNGKKGKGDKKEAPTMPGGMGAGGMPDMANMGEMMFKMMDKNGDGVITKKEMGEGPEGAPAPKGDEADQMFKQMDTDGDGKVTRKEADKVFEMMMGMMGGKGGMPGGMPGMPGAGGGPGGL